MYLREVKPNDWNGVRENFQKLNSSLGLGPASSPTYAGLTITGLTASRLIWTDANKLLASKDIVDLVAGTTNQITVTDGGVGDVILSTPQDIHADATPEFAGFVIKDSSNNVIFYADDDEVYFPEAVAVGLTGQPIGLLIALTYAS